MEEKIIKGWLIVDYKSGGMRCAKKLKGTRSSLKLSEIPVGISIKVQVPEEPILKAEGTIKLSQTQISAMIIDGIAEPTDVDDKNEKW